MSEALSALAQGEVFQPLRTITRPPDAAGLLGTMPAYRTGEHSSFGIKVISVFPNNPSQGKDAHQGAVLLLSPQTGELLALMNASAITALRTAAVSAVATRKLAREDASQLTIIGAGVQARTHLKALAQVRQIKRARVVSKNVENAMKLAREMEMEFDFPIIPVAEAQEAVEGADLIVTATSSAVPVLSHEWIANGAHINAIGTHSPQSREIDGHTMAASRIFVDRRESALNESGDYLLAAQEGLITADNIVAEIGEVIIGKNQGRRTKSEVTLFKSLGLAIEDVACAEYLYNKARKINAGSWVEY